MIYNSSINTGFYNYQAPIFGAQPQVAASPVNFSANPRVAKEDDNFFTLKNVAIVGAVIAAGVFAHKKGVFSKLFEGEKATTNTSKVVTTTAGDSLQVTSAAPAVPKVVPSYAPPKAAAKAVASSLSPDLSLKMQNKQIELLESLRQGYETKGNTKMVDNMVALIDSTKNGKTTPSINDLYNNRYRELRTNCDYKADARHDDTIASLSGAETTLTEVNNSGGWHFRLPKNRRAQGWSTSGKSDYRVSVNAVADKNLIKSLDDLFASGEVKGYFKTPEHSDEWLKRHDPITIYLHEDVTPEILQKIEARTKGHIRSTDNVLVGYKFAPGLALERSPNEQDMKKLIQEAAQIHPSFAKDTEDQFTQGGMRGLKSSAGEVTAVKDTLAYLKGEPAHSSKSYKDLDEFLADV